ncbi:hypothetical protein E3N88_32924 [Mikania micrantha]|uniref:Uncharacterized protein n=1 Tax=Mikania micrantha TaxID=192012 RepID=A0A5N6M9W5_9ASTR|nr:hypothetical protein E3N88_32924 [Mikania micrantha]
MEKKWSSRYAMAKLRVLRDGEVANLHKKIRFHHHPHSCCFQSTTPPPPSKFSSSNPQNLHFEGLTTFRSLPGTFIRVQIIFLSAGIRQNRISSLAPVASVPIAVRYQGNSDDTNETYDIISGDERWGCDRVVSEPQQWQTKERDIYIYQRIPYVMSDDTPSSSSGSDSDPSEAVSLASHTSTVPPIPPLPEPVPVPPSPPAPPIIPSPPHSPPADPVADRRHSISPPRVPAWDGLWR